MLAQHEPSYPIKYPVLVDGTADVVEVVSGNSHSLWLTSDGTVYAWGAGGHGQLGIHSDNDHTIPYQVHGPDNEGYLSGIGPTCPPTDSP